MNYSKDQFFALMESAEAQGCELLDEVCSPRVYSLTGTKGKPVTFPMCGNSTIFEVPYLPEPGSEDPAAPPTIKLCAVDDSLGLWPRFAGRKK